VTLSGMCLIELLNFAVSCVSHAIMNHYQMPLLWHIGACLSLQLAAAVAYDAHSPWCFTSKLFTLLPKG